MGERRPFVRFVLEGLSRSSFVHNEHIALLLLP
jgi:hypothetical protein